ncbi:head GIN domain-containing protein [Roseateles oligotrophus]|uniref:DUF2807 domain-containing protein n=1 Tax=Roseateles oligotrophus TaxID=1769250 RepID=A0ABT2YKN4_9BURK|nr:head GIN domain-containing protein [Roseateles oligotrophus]MCV2370609.1 DUF2807 domain-containing protein [Roseateles oligotrophus]
MNKLAIAMGCLLGLLASSAFGQAQAKIVVRQGVEGRLYTPGPFERIELAGSANVRLLQGESDELFIVGDAQEQEGVTVTLAQGRLDFRSHTGWKIWPAKRLQVEVTVRQLQELVLSGASDLQAPAKFKAGPLLIKLSGAGSARFDDLNAERLEFSISGAGEGFLRGQVNLLDLKISGKGRLAAEDLQAHTANVRISGIGNAELWVSEKLNLDISGVGQIAYWGQPTVSRTTSGIAKVLARGDRKAPPVLPAMPAMPAPPAAPAAPARQ